MKTVGEYWKELIQIDGKKTLRQRWKEALVNPLYYAIWAMLIMFAIIQYKSI